MYNTGAMEPWVASERTVMQMLSCQTLIMKRVCEEAVMAHHVAHNVKPAFIRGVCSEKAMLAVTRPSAPDGC